MNLLHDLKAYDTDSNGLGKTTLRVLVEVSKGSLHKYEYNEQFGYLTIVRDLHENYRYPFSYGAIPQTLGGDNDPLDAIIVSDEPIVPCTVVNCNIVGVIKTVDNGEVDDKILVVPYYVKAGSVNLTKILKYLNEYKYPRQEGTYITQVLGAREAKKLVAEAIANYERRAKVK